MKKELGIKFGWLSQKKLDNITSLELKNFKSLNGIDSLNNLEELKLIINAPDIDIDSYCDSIGKLHNLDKLDVNIPDVTYLDNNQVKGLSDNKDVKVSFNISTISWFDESYNAEEMTQLQKHFAEVRDNANQNIQQNYKPVSRVNTINQDMDR